MKKDTIVIGTRSSKLALWQAEYVKGRLEEEYPDLLYTGKSLFLPPDNESDITPEVMDLLNRDPETLIFDILNYYKNGAKGKPIVPKELLEASPYNQGILEILKQIYDRRVK